MNKADIYYWLGVTSIVIACHDWQGSLMVFGCMCVLRAIVSVFGYILRNEL